MTGRKTAGNLSRTQLRGCEPDVGTTNDLFGGLDAHDSVTGGDVPAAVPSPTNDNAREAGSAKAEVQAAREDGLGEREEGEKGGKSVDPCSIEGVASFQRAAYEKGLASASAYWKARGITWP